MQLRSSADLCPAASASKQPVIIVNPFAPTKPETSDKVGGLMSQLPPQQGDKSGKKTLVLDLDETLIHSTTEPQANANYIMPVNYIAT